MNLTDYIAAAPEMTLLGLICVVMIVDLFIDDEPAGVEYGDREVRQARYETRAFPMPNACLGVIFENISNAESNATS